MSIQLKKYAACIGFVAAGLLSTGASAFPLSAQLTGDPRTANPDNLIIDVTITAVDSNTVKFVVDINSPLHPNAKLDEFYFNVDGAAADFTFDGFSPAGWNIIASSGGAQGSGNAVFLFEALDPAGPPNAPDVTNTVNLVFNLNYVGSGSLSDALFLNAASSCSNDVVLGCGQLGAHLQSLSIPSGTNITSDSGFLMGGYLRPPTRIPEPGTLALVGGMLLAVGVTGMRRRGR